MISVKLILTLSVAFLLASTIEGAELGKERPIAIGAGTSQEQPAIDGHIVSWVDNRSGNYDIFIYDLETGLEDWVCINPLYQISPAVSGERIVWQDMRSGNADIYLYDVINRTEKPIITNEGNQTQPDISGEYLAWSDDRNGPSNIYILDLKNMQEKRISPSEKDQINPKISDGRVVWMDRRSGDFDVYLYDIKSGSELSLATGKGNQSFPSIHGEMVAWADDISGGDLNYINLSTKQQGSLKKAGNQTEPDVYDNYISYLNNGTEVWLYDIKSEKDFELNRGSIKWEPAISDRGVVWTDYRNGPKDPDIYMFDFRILADIPITTGHFNHTNPSFSEDNIVWTDDRTGNFEVYAFNTTNGQEKQLTNTGINHSSPDISENNVIWADKSKGNINIFLYDLENNQTKQVTSGNYDHRYPMVDGNRIIWVDDRSGSDQIYQYDISLGKERQITNQKSLKLSPVISQDKIVWIDDRNGNWDVYLYDMSSGKETAVTTNPARQAQPWIYGDTIVWADGRNAQTGTVNWDIYSYNLTTKTERSVVTNPSNQGYPTIYGKYVAWLDERSGTPAIFLRDLTKEVEVPIAIKPAVQTPGDGKGDPYQVKPHASSKVISDSKIVWMDRSQGVSQIMMRYIIADPLLLLETDFPNTNGSLMVWSDNRRGNWNIYGFDFFSRSEKPISRSDSNKLYPSASGDRVVWSDYKDGKAQVYLKNLTTGNETALTSGKGFKIWPSISKDHVTWMDNSSGNWDVYLYDIETGKVQPIRKGPGQQMYPVVSGDLIVWQDDRNKDWDIYAYDLNLSQETKLTDKGDQIYPDVSGNTIVWEDTSSGDISYYLWNKKWGKNYPREGNQTNPVVSGQFIGYVDESPQGSSIRKLDISNWKDELVAQGPGQIKPNIDQKLVWLNSLTSKPRYAPLGSGQISIICDAPGDQTRPAVGGNDQVGYYVAWMDNRTGKPDVYVYSLGQHVEIPLAAGPFEEMYPDIAGSIISWITRNPQNQYNIENYWTIRTFDVAIDNRSELVWGLSSPAPISIGDQYLAYSDTPVAKFGSRVYKRLLYAKETAPAIPPGGINPRTGGDLVVYQDNAGGNGNWNVWLWKQGSDPVQVTSSNGDHINPVTDGKILAWQDNRNGHWDIYAYDLNTKKETQVTRGETDHANPDIENSVIVWQDMRNGNWDIYAFDLNNNKEKAIVEAPGNQTEPRIRASKIVWTDDRSGNKDIYIYENYMP